jgi:hypothetical protein
MVRTCLAQRCLPAEEVDILGVSPEMKAFVSANGRDTSVDWLRMKRLTEWDGQAGYLDLQYEAGRTFTAAEAFRSNAGNCLVVHQSVRCAGARKSPGCAVPDRRRRRSGIPPMDGMLNSHINVIVAACGWDRRTTSASLVITSSTSIRRSTKARGRVTS